MIPILLLAAGRSSRMLGRDKLLEPVNGTPVLRLLADRAISVGPTYVALPNSNAARRAVLPNAAQIIPVKDAENGLSHSLRAGIAGIPPAAKGVIILPADMPDITASDLLHIKTLAQRESPAILRATTEDGKPGHPIYFERSLFPLFKGLTGDRGAYQICIAHRDATVFVPLKGQRARLDLDTPEDWDTYRNRPTT